MAQRKEMATFDKYAIFQTGGKQYQALEGKTIGIEKLDVEEGGNVTFDQVLLRKTGEGKIEVGKPFLKAAIKATVVKHMKGLKLIAFKLSVVRNIRVSKVIDSLLLWCESNLFNR